MRPARRLPRRELLAGDRRQLSMDRVSLLYHERNVIFIFSAVGRSHSYMNSHKRLHLKTYLMITIMVLAGPMGNVLLGKAMKGLGKLTVSSPADLGHVAMRVFTSGTLWLGIASLCTFFVAYMLVLSWADYSYVQTASSIAYAVVALLGATVLGEFVSPTRWVGIAIICLGVFIVGQTGPRTTEKT